MFAVASSTPARCAAPAAGVRAKSAGAARSRACFAGSRVQARSELRMQSGRKSSVECRAAAEKGEMVGSDASTIGNNLNIEMDIDKIMSLLPHRYPFLLVDRVIEYEQGSYAIGLKNVTINDNFFPGHFPQRPIMPGVLMVEAMAQVGGLVMMDPEEAGEGGTTKEFFFAGIDGVKFRRPVVPGDQLVMKVELTKMNKRFGIAKMKGQCFIGDALACEAVLTLAMGS